MNRINIKNEEKGKGDKWQEKGRNGKERGEYNFRSGIVLNICN